MSSSVGVTRRGTSSFDHLLKSRLATLRPRCVGVVSAFVSVDGIVRLNQLLRNDQTITRRLIAGISREVTHPEALSIAVETGWCVRLGDCPGSIYHPKLLVAGDSFNDSYGVDDLCFVYVGSANLTAGGLHRNVECGYESFGSDCPASASDSFALLWSESRPIDENGLRNYAAKFAEQARRRSVQELEDLDVAVESVTDESEVLLKTPPKRAAIHHKFAVAAWAGLKSFTGEYRFQVEFPRDAGRVIEENLLFGAVVGSDGEVEVFCPSDGQTRSMQYRYYEENGMFRLNIPNDVPGVQWARSHKEGIALVERGPQGGAALRLTILAPGTEMTASVSRSITLGTWGKTSTRAYGWY